MKGGRTHVELRGVSKRFGATQALRDVSVSVARGEIHALVGENGAGKSTLGKIVGGVYVLDDGELLVDGRDVGRWNPTQALRSGIATIQQELSLVPALSVAENVFLGIEQSRWGVLAGSKADRYRALDATVGFGIPGDAAVKRLRLADQQKVEILRALARDARLIVLDEPTSSLSREEADRLHGVMRALRDEGRTLLYVSHFLEEVLAVADTVTVMRDGEVVRTRAAAEETAESLVEGMLGRKLDANYPPLAPVAKDASVVYQCKSLSGGIPRDVTLEVRAGEVLGLAGLVGSGRSEFARMVAGADPILAGTHELNGESLGGLTSREAIAAGIAMVPEDRRSQGLILTQNTRENITLPRLGRFARLGSVQGAAERRAVVEKIDELNIVPPRVNGGLRHYSGGNQQKALFAKWTLSRPELIVLDEPTRGVDVGAKRSIYDAIINVAAKGAAVILISSELEEVVRMSHRVALIDGGRVVDIIDTAGLTGDSVLEKLFRHSESGVGG